MRKDKKGFILHIPFCKITHKSLEPSTRIPRSSQDGHLVVVTNHDILFKPSRAKFPEYCCFDKTCPIHFPLDCLYLPQYLKIFTLTKPIELLE